MRITAIVDLNGTLVRPEAWNNGKITQGPIDGAVTAMQEMRDWGWRLIVWSVNNNVTEIMAWLHENDIPFDHVNEAHYPGAPSCPTGKLIGNIYFDDRDAHCVGKPYPWDHVMDRLRRLYAL